MPAPPAVPQKPAPPESLKVENVFPTPAVPAESEPAPDAAPPEVIETKREALRERTVGKR